MLFHYDIKHIAILIVHQFTLKVETTREIRDQAMITEILDTVEKLVDFGLDVVDMAEECRDPAIPY